jgi:Restriction endonuclease
MYDFRTLSPLDFEELVRDLLQAEFGLLLESFGPGRDLGIDFRFARAGGSAIVQAKHYPASGSAALLRIARKENEKVAKLKPGRYLLATSASLSPPLKGKLQAAMPAAPLAAGDILGRDDLNNLLGRHPHIEKKHFKLWLASTAVLERILHSGVYNRTQAEMEIIKKMVPKFVHNESVPQSEAILSKYGALIIIGEPGVGKSTLARMLVWLHVEQNWRISVIDDIKEAFEVANGVEKRLIFFDDFLGQVRLSTDLIRGVDQRFHPFFQRVRTNKNIRFILTSRDYILRQAQQQSTRLSSPAVNASEFTLNVGLYTRESRARMLFNHMYFSDISVHERNALLEGDFYLKIIDHRNFNPRLMEFLTAAEYVSVTGMPIRTAVEAVLENPHELWEKPYRNHISEEARALMLALFFNEKSPTIPALERAFGRMTSAMGLPFARADIPVKFRSALKEIEGSVLAIQERRVSFSNPGVRDFLERAVDEDRFLPVAVGAVTEFAEVNQAWRFFWAQRFPPRRLWSDAGGIEKDDFLASHFTGPTPTPTLAPTEWESKTPPRPKKPQDPSSTAWVGAARRLLKDGSGSALQRLNLVITMYNELYDSQEAEELLQLVSDCIRALQHSKAEQLVEDFSFGLEALEQIHSSSLPLDVRDDAKRALSNVLMTILIDYGNFDFYEVESFVTALFEFSVDKDAAAIAANEALQGHLTHLWWARFELGTSEDVQEHAERLRTIVNEYGCLNKEVVSSIEVTIRRIEDLLSKSEESEGDYKETGPGFPSVEEITSDQIRSLFGQLRSEDI